MVVSVWLYFMDVRHTKNFHAVLPSWLPPLVYFKCLFSFGRKRERERAGTRALAEKVQREGDRSSKAGSELTAVSLMQGSQKIGIKVLKG